VIELLDTILEHRFKVRDLSTRHTSNSVMRKSRVTVGGKRRGGKGREPDLGGGLVGGRQGFEGLFVGAQGVGAAGDVEGGVMQVLHGGGVVVLLHFLGDELGGEKDVVEIHEQVVVLDVEDADGGAQAIHSGSGHGHDKQHNKWNPRATLLQANNFRQSLSLRTHFPGGESGRAREARKSKSSK
jgi:hypothetical protein